METLRQEVLNSQSVRSDLLKYKLFVVGGVGAAGLGLAGSTATGHADLVLCAVPLACLYIDLLCRHLSLRILVIGTYMRGKDEDPYAEYEEFVEDARKLPNGNGGNSAFALEDWAVSWSTYVLSGAVLAYGAIIPFATDSKWWAYVPFILSGLLGIAVTVAAQLEFGKRFSWVRYLTP